MGGKTKDQLSYYTNKEKISNNEIRRYMLERFKNNGLKLFLDSVDLDDLNVFTT
jgi:hypothetical protein